MYKPPGGKDYVGYGAYSTVPPVSGKRKGTGIETHLAQIGYGTASGPPSQHTGYVQHRTRTEEAYVA